MSIALILLKISWKSLYSLGISTWTLHLGLSVVIEDTLSCGYSTVTMLWPLHDLTAVPWYGLIVLMLPGDTKDYGVFGNVGDHKRDGFWIEVEGIEEDWLGALSNGTAIYCADLGWIVEWMEWDLELLCCGVIDEVPRWAGGETLHLRVQSEWEWRMEVDKHRCVFYQLWPAIK